MPSGWGSYYIVFLSAVLALGIPAALGLISFLVSPAKKRKALPPETPADHAVSSGHTVLGSRINVRFFLAANAALVLLTLILALIPCVVTLHASEERTALLRGLISIVTIPGFASLGLFYCAKKGDLSWLRSVQKGDQP